jgi:hypothetical protein
MRNIWLGLAVVAIVTVKPTLAQENKNNVAECAKDVGVKRDGSGRPRYHDEAQHIAFMDCLTRKAHVPPPPAAKKPGGSRNSN